jgi:hypothetical protein
MNKVLGNGVESRVAVLNLALGLFGTSFHIALLGFLHNFILLRLQAGLGRVI